MSTAVLPCYVLTSTRLPAIDHHPLGLAVEPVFNPPHCLLIQPILHQLLYEADSAKSPTDVKVDNIHCSPIVYQASHFIIEGYQVGQAWLCCYESVLTIPNQLLVLHVTGNGFQD